MTRGMKQTRCVPFKHCHGCSLKCHVRLCCMIICGYCHTMCIPVSCLFIASASCTGCVLIPSLCHEPMEGPCRLLKCIHRALCCPNVVSKKETISWALVFIKCICAIRISSFIPPMIDVGVLIRTGFCFTLVKHGIESGAFA